MSQKWFKQTKFDSMVSNKQMQLIKAVIPYINNNAGNYIGMYIKFIELQNTINLFKYIQNTDKPPEITEMLDDICDFLDDNEKETLETIKMMFELMSSTDFNTEDFMNNYMNMI